MSDNVRQLDGFCNIHKPSPPSLIVECPWCQIDRLRAELDEIYRGVGLDTSFSVVPSDVISKFQSLERDLAEANKRIEELGLECGRHVATIGDRNQSIRLAQERIEELLDGDVEIELKNGDILNGHIITDDQIDAAWEEAQGAFYIWQGAVFHVLEKLGIVVCPKCRGTKLNIDDDGDVSHPVNMGECDCPHNGWVMEGR